MDPHKMKGVTRETEGQRTFHRMEVSYESVPQITSITAEERILPYVDRYYLFVNDERVPVDIRQPEIKQVIYEFYKDLGLYHTRKSGYVPNPGDIVIFSSIGHAGIVESVSGSTVTVIEGNYSDSVVRNTYSIKSSKIAGYASPDYN